jgi:peptidoglycan/xylan/chitin deacetylase (PgdA/CDA1 family)
MKKIVYFLGVFFLIVSCSFHDDGINADDNGSGILLGFDDYHVESWNASLDLFDRYNAKVTFFVTLETPTPFCSDAQARGHEIAYHTIHHPRLPDLSYEDFLTETVSAISFFAAAGIELKTFAYPYGVWKGWMHQVLLAYYKTVRGFDRDFYVYKIDEARTGYLGSMSIDNINYPGDGEFKKTMERILKIVKLSANNVVPVTSHAISNDDWGITRGRLEWLLKKCSELNLRFYTYKEL